MPQDGGLYVPCQTADLRRWILFMDEKTKFSSIAGSLTSAFINDEFSPIICETIATNAFKFSPEIRQLDENLYILELFHTPTGMHRDFGLSFLTSCIETILTLRGGSSVFLDVSTGELGASLALALRNKKHLKAVIVYPKGKIRGIDQRDFIWNGGNILPVEVDGTEQDCHQIVRTVFADRDFIEKNCITVANTANIGRLLPQAFFYPYAFSRIKSRISGSIEYALAPGNYSNLVAGLYAWQFALPLNGFVIPATQDISVDAKGSPILLDSVVPLEKRESADPSEPSNIERLENVFRANSMMMKHFIYPQAIEKNDVDWAAKELFTKSGLYADRHTARALAAIDSRKKNGRGETDGVTTVLIARDSPCLSEEYVRHTLGEVPEMPETIRETFKPVQLNRPLIKTPEELKGLFSTLN